MIELAIFDMAGTTVRDGDAVKLAFRAAMAGVGVETDPVFVNTVMGLPKPEAIRLLLEKAGRPIVEAEIESIHADFVRRMKSYYANDPAVGAIPGAVEAFAALRKAGVKVALNTGFSRPIVEVLLGRLGWGVPAVIDACVTSDEAPRGRPSPDMIHLLMRRLGVTDSAKVAKIGDTWADLDEGASAGCGLNIGVTTGSLTREQLQSRPHTHVVESVADVPAIIAAHGR